MVDPGTLVEVRSRFDRAWARGFEVAEELAGAFGSEAGYRIRRRSDGSILPVVFQRDDLREERRRGNSMWWV